MTNIMFFDVETNGLPINWRAPMTDLDNWPRVIQLAWHACDTQGNTLENGNFLIRPDGWTIPDGSDGKDATFWLQHGFSTARAEAEGTPMTDALPIFLEDLQDCAYLVSHNMDFDHNVLGAESLRYGLKSAHRPTRICTKEASTEYCCIPFANRRERRPWMKQSYKWPKLEELHQKLFGTPVADAHDALGDVLALKACFFELVRLGVIVLPPKEDAPA